MLKVDGLFGAFAGDHDLNRRAARPFQQVGDFGGGQVVGAIYR